MPARKGRTSPAGSNPVFNCSGADHDSRAEVGDTIEALCEVGRQPDAAVAGRVAGVMARMQRGPILVEHLHKGHGRVFVLLAAVHHFLGENGEYALGRRLFVFAG